MQDPKVFITSEHRVGTKFMATVEALIKPFADLQTLYAGMETTYFDLDTAVGNQLDVLGQWLGASRILTTPITAVYFTFDSDTLGFDYGSWEGTYTPETGITELDDETYRLVLKAKAVNNKWDGTITTAYDITDAIFSDQKLLLYIKDNGNMSIDIGILSSSALAAITKRLIETSVISFKPAAVRINDYLYVGPAFSWDEASVLAQGWGLGYFWE